MIEYQEGVVLEQVDMWGSTQELLIRMTDGSTHKAIHYMDNIPQLHPGDLVRLNTTAVTLKLGSGGYHYVHTVLSSTASADAATLANVLPISKSFNASNDISSGHIMKLRYTSLQRSVLAAEEPASPHHKLFLEHRSLEGMPVLIGELHSMLPIVAAWITWRQRNCTDWKPIKLSYIMSDGAALPLSFSKHTQLLNELGWITGSITYGHAYGGDVETVNKFTALLAAKHILHSDIAVVIMGPGIVGTGTVLGHSGMEVSELIHAVRMLGGNPIVIPRISFADERKRHHGFSHHLLTLLSQFTLIPAWLPIPTELPTQQSDLLQQQLHLHKLADKHHISWVESIGSDQVEQSLKLYPAQVISMGRRFEDDPAFYISISCAAELALKHVPAASASV
ncbi:MAG: DUF3866 family protein [Paenibacillaceae bacterium]